MKKSFYLQLKRRAFNALIILVALSSVAALCDPEDLSFTVSKLMDDTYEVSLADDGDGDGMLSDIEVGTIDLQNSDEFQEYKDDMTVTAINEMYAIISPAEGETEIIGNGEIIELAVGLNDMNIGAEHEWELVKYLVDPIDDMPVTLQSLDGMKLDIRNLFSQQEIDLLIKTFNNEPIVEYGILYNVAGEAPVKFKVTYYIDISAQVQPL